MRVSINSSRFPRAMLDKMIDGVAVYDATARRVGTIREKEAHSPVRRAPYAIVSLGGCLGMGEDFRPVPWSVLSYNKQTDCYHTTLSEDQVRNAPIYTHESNWNEDRWAKRVRNHYGIKRNLS